MKAPPRSDTIVEALIEGELAVGEACRLALEGAGPEAAEELRRLADEHLQSAGALRGRCRRAAPVSSESWATWSAPPPEGAVRAVLYAEERGVREYEAALEYEGLEESCRCLIATELLPRARAHLARLGRLAGAMGG